jgi:hypothetical protein
MEALSTLGAVSPPYVGGTAKVRSVTPIGWGVTTAGPVHDPFAAASRLAVCGRSSRRICAEIAKLPLLGMACPETAPGAGMALGERRRQ